MQVNFNPSVNQVIPNFKASFSNDAETRKIIKKLEMTRNGFADILATHYALKDMDSKDIIGLVYDLDRNGYYAKNLTNGKEIELSGYFSEDTASRLERAISKKELINEEPKLKGLEYYNRACELIRTVAKKELDIAEKLSPKIRAAEARGEIRKADELRNKLSKTNGDKLQKIFEAIEKELFPLAKKVK